MNIKLLIELVKLAQQATGVQQGVTNEDYQMMSTDDVYLAGYEDGKIVLARELLNDMGIDWREES
jgi:hypothetical protein